MCMRSMGRGLAIRPDLRAGRQRILRGQIIHGEIGAAVLLLVVGLVMPSKHMILGISTGWLIDVLDFAV